MTRSTGNGAHIFRSGIAQPETALVDTRNTLFLADGFIDFNQELADLVIEPRPKNFSLFSLRSGLHIEGRLKQPAVYPGDALFARAGAAAALARSVDGVGNMANRLEVKQF